MALNAVVRDAFSAPFFDASAEGTLLLRFSPSSGTWSDPAARVCSTTQADDLEWRPAAGTGTLVTWTIKPGRVKDDVVIPDVILGVVELDEGPWLSLWFPDATPTALRAGASVRVDFTTPEGSEALPIGVLT